VSRRYINVDPGNRIKRAHRGNRIRWEFLSAIIDSHGECTGIVALNQRTMEVKAFRAGAVLLATGGPGILRLSQSPKVFTRISAQKAWLIHEVD